MSSIGLARRWHRFTHHTSGRALIVPIDHGLTLGPIDGLNHLDDIRRWLASGELTGVVMHKGMVERLDGAQSIGLMVHLNGAVSLNNPVQAVAPPLKVRLATIEAAIGLGADAVSVHLDMGGQWSSHYLSLLGEVVDEAHSFGIPVMAMLYDKMPGAEPGNLQRQRHFMRAAVELGADILKVQPPAELTCMGELLEGFEHTRVLFAGGELRSDRGSIALARAVAQHGGAGLCVGRNIFQRPDPITSLREISNALHECVDLDALVSRPIAEEMLR